MGRFIGTIISRFGGFVLDWRGRPIPAIFSTVAALPYFCPLRCRPRSGQLSLFLVWIYAGLVSVPTLCDARQGTNNARPNILVILTDDQRFDSLGCSGNTIIKTPNLDRLASEGTYFKNAFVVTAMCCPSRATLLTGQYWWRHGVRTNYGDLLTMETTWPVLLQRAGYRTLFVGKWHLGEWRRERSDGLRRCFDEWISVEIARGGASKALNVNGIERRISGNLTEGLTDGAIDLIREHRDSPFAMLLAYAAPHPPHHAPRKLLTMYEDVEFPMPKTYFEDAQKTPRSARTAKFNADTLRRFYTPPKKWQESIRGYARMVTAIDESVGRIMGTLDQLGLAEKTLVVFTSDHGVLQGEHGLGGKNLMYEESIRVPLILRCAASIPVGHLEDAIIRNIDLAPTLLEFAGVKIPSEMQGRSVLKLLRGAGDWAEELLYCSGRGAPGRPEGPPFVMGIRTRGEKLAVYAGGERELFDLRADPFEQHNLIDTEEGRKLERKLLPRLKKACAAYGGPPKIAGLDGS